MGGGGWKTLGNFSADGNRLDCVEDMNAVSDLIGNVVEFDESEKLLNFICFAT